LRVRDFPCGRAGLVGLGEGGTRELALLLEQLFLLGGSLRLPCGARLVDLALQLDALYAAVAPPRTTARDHK